MIKFIYLTYLPNPIWGISIWKGHCGGSQINSEDENRDSRMLWSELPYESKSQSNQSYDGGLKKY